MKTPRWLEVRWRGLAALLAGTTLPLAFAPFHLFPLALIAPAGLFLLWRDAVPRAAFRYGLLFGIGMFGFGVSWVYVAIHDFAYTPVWLALLLTALFVAILSLYPALLGWASARLARRVPSVPVQLLVLFPALWVLAEWIRGRFMTGFPWLNLGYSLGDTPLAGLAPVFGVYGISLAAAATAGAIAWLVTGRGRSRWTAAVLIVVVWAGGALVGTLQWVEPAGEPIRASLVQGNQPQVNKWDPDQVERRLDVYANRTLPELKRSDLVVWPENAITLFHQDLPRYFAWLTRKARESGAELVFGVPLRHHDGINYYTTMGRIGSGEPTFYRKRHLVPFGEYVPMEGTLRGLIDFFDLPMSGFTPGPQEQRLMEAAGHPLAVSICYEDAFGEEIIDFLPEAHILINGSNNAWYGDSLAPHQHLQISRMRTLETGRPLLRATTNGISVVFDHQGRELARSRQFVTDVIRAEVQPMQGTTPYVVWSNAPVLLLAVIMLAVALALGRLRDRRRS